MKIFYIIALLMLLPINSSAALSNFGLDYTLMNSDIKGPCTVYFHGNSSSKKAMKNLTMRSSNCSLNMSLLGHGDSRRPISYSQELLNKSINDLLKETGLSKRELYAVCWSLGCNMLAELMKANNPPNFTKVNLTETFLVDLQLAPIFKSHPAISGGLFAKGHLTEKELRQLTDGYHSKFDAGVYYDIRDTDPLFREFIGSGLDAGVFLDEISAIQKISKRCVSYSPLNKLLDGEYSQRLAAILNAEVFVIEGPHDLPISRPKELSMATNECFD